MLDEDRFLRMQHDAPAHICEVKIVVNHDGTMGMTGPFGDKELFMMVLQQAMDCVRQNGKDRGTLIVPADYGEAKARPEGYF